MTGPLDEIAQDAALPTFEVFARFCVEAPSAAEAQATVVRMLAEADDRPSDVVLERQERPGAWMVVARFVVVSIEAHTAVVGVSETLAELLPDEVWAGDQLA